MTAIAPSHATSTAAAPSVPRVSASRSAIRQPQDHPHLHLAARALAELVADGTIGYRVAASAVAQAAHRVHPLNDALMFGLRDRLEHTIGRAIDEIENSVAASIRASVRALVNKPPRPDKRWPPSVLVHHACLVNEAAGEPFSRTAVERIAADEAIRAAGRTARSSC